MTLEVTKLMFKKDVKEVATDYLQLSSFLDDVGNANGSFSGFLNGDEFFLFFKNGRKVWKGKIKKENSTYVVYSDVELSARELATSLKVLIEHYKKLKEPEADFFVELEGYLASLASGDRIELRKSDNEKVVRLNRKIVL